MKERPILFKAPMVRAILDGSKTMTRRVVKQDRDGLLDCEPTPAWDAFWQCVACPYGQPGDRLWVRETWRASSAHDSLPPKSIPVGDGIEYAADKTPDYLLGKSRPSIHMPRWASRILLEITDVRVERVQDISEADAISEGVQHSTLNDPRVEYRWLWESINGPDSWAANPWVWVIEFRMVNP